MSEETLEPAVLTVEAPRMRRTSLALASALAFVAGAAVDIPRPQINDNSPRIIPSRNQSKRVKGNARNERCACGSGKKRKNCPCGGFSTRPPAEPAD